MTSDELREDELMHYGTLHKSGRYPWGSGETPNQRNKQFLDYVDQLSKRGLTDSEIAKGIGMSRNDLQATKSNAKTELRAAQQSEAHRLKERGLSNIAIGDKLGLNESSVRALLDPSRVARNNTLQNTVKMLETELKEKGAIDIGSGVELHAGISRQQLLNAVAYLKTQGYETSYERIEQVTTGKETTMKVLRRGDVDWKDIRNNPEKIGTIAQFTEDNGRTWSAPKPPLSFDSKRLAVRYGDEGGSDMDGVMQIRRGVDDLSLGGKQYAQVRIAVDGSHYLKGMAMYADDLPDGVDIRFNTNKSNTGDKLDALKPLKVDKNTGKVDEKNPFGAQISRQILDQPGQKGKPTSVMNIVNEEGDWNKWSKNISSQVLSKQSTELIKKQLGLRLAEKQAEYEEIINLTNPEVRRHLLQKFSDDMDASAVHLKAAALPRQRTQVILPINSLKDTEIYAPNFRNGEKVVLVRYPHGGKFEIPELTVNNRNREAGSVIKNALDAVGINSNVASRLSGADFDGDTVLVIPNNNRAIKTESPLKGLKGFDPQTAYPAYEGMPRMSPKTKQQKMGDVSNLITDMTVMGAPNHELERAVRHSMVVIDAEKHNLNWRQSAKDNNIAELKERYQGGKTKGAATLISRASSKAVVDDRIERRASEGGPIDPLTGRKVYTPTGKGYTNAKGEWVPKKINSTKMFETDDARTLISKDGTVRESLYADYANRLKGLANQSRKEILVTPTIKRSAQSAKVYGPQVKKLNADLNLALRNAPLERQAQLIAGARVKAQRDANPAMDAAELKKVRSMALQDARNRTGAGKARIELTADQWEAIQAGAISPTKLRTILDNSDTDKLKEWATPREKQVMTPGKTARAKAMSASGFTPSEIADALGVSVSTLHDTLA